MSSQNMGIPVKAHQGQGQMDTSNEVQGQLLKQLLIVTRELTLQLQAVNYEMER